jgi:hypothetical protein
MIPIVCPLCTRSSLQPLFQEVKITAQINGEREVGGLLAHKNVPSSVTFSSSAEWIWKPTPDCSKQWEVCMPS